MAIAGRFDFNPAVDTLLDKNGNSVKLDEPNGYTFPVKGFEVKDNGFIGPSENHSDINVVISPTSDRLQKLEPFAPWDGKDLMDMLLLIKTQGKCTTDHISMAGTLVEVPRTFAEYLQQPADGCRECVQW